MGRFGRKLARKHQTKPIPAEYLELIERLRQATLEAEDISEPWDVFHDELVQTSGFQMAGVRAKNAPLTREIQTSAQRVAPDCVVSASLLIQLGDLWHGMAESSSGPMVFYYFEKQDVGVLGLLGEDTRQLTRFSLATVT